MDARTSLVVMAGLDPAIHVFLSLGSKPWTPGTNPGAIVFGEV